MKLFAASIFILTLAFFTFAQTETEAEVVVPTTFVRKAPNPGAEKIQTVQRGDKFNVDSKRESNGWYLVTVAGKTKGWINANTVRLSTSAAAVTKNSSVAPPAENRTGTTSRPAPSPESRRRTSVPANVNSGARTRTVEAPGAEASSSPSPAEAAAPAAKEEPEEVLRVETQEIILNVRVVDANNRAVRNLNRTQFQIFENGVLQEITSVGTTEVPVVNALLIDNSRSLRSQLSKVIEAGKIIAGANRPQDATTVVRFVSADKIEVVQDFTSNKNSIAGALDNLFVEGGQTAIIDALYKTAQKVEEFQDAANRDDPKVRAVILVSDGDDRGSSYNEQQLFDLLRRLDVQIYAVGFPNDLSDAPDQSGTSRRARAKSFLERLAQETGGKVYFPLSTEELPKIAQEISGELRTQYQISYTPTEEGQRGTFKKINVAVAEGENKEKRTAITRSGRTVSP